MKYFYDDEHDSLLIELRDGEYRDSEEVTPGIVIDFDTAGKPLAIDIMNASATVDLGALAANAASPVDLSARRRGA